MKLTRWILFFILLLLPIAGRALWYYSGTYQRSEPVATPDYAKLAVVEPAFSTPMPTPFAPIGGDAPVVVLDMAHGNALLLSEVDPLVDALRSAGAKVVVDDGYGLYLPEQLKKADAYVVLMPTSGFDATTIQEVQRFVERGGRLLVAVDPTRAYGYYSTYSSSEAANLLLAPFGLAFSEDYAYNMLKNESNFRNLILEDFTERPLTAGLKQVVFYSAQSIAKAPQALIRGDANTLSSLDDKGGNLVLAAASADSRVVALGDATFMTSPYLQVADNQVLLSNLVTFLTGGGSERVHDLKDYPYLFDHNLVVIVDDDFELDQKTVSLFSDLQKMMSGENLDVRFGESAVPGQDAIYLSKMPPEDERLSAFVSMLGITFTEDTGEEETSGLEELPVEATPTPTFDFGGEDTSTETVYQVGVPGIGKFSNHEFGIILYQAGAVQNQMLILGGTWDQVLELADRLVGDEGLSGCMVMEQIAICPVTNDSETTDDYGGGYDYNYNYDYNYFDVTPTPTPVG